MKEETKKKAVVERELPSEDLCVTKEENEFAIDEVPKVVKHWGGARAGSGRKKDLTKEDTCTYAMRITVTTRERITELTERGVKVGRMFEDYIRTLAETFGIN